MLDYIKFKALLLTLKGTVNTYVLFTKIATGDAKLKLLKGMNEMVEDLLESDVPHIQEIGVNLLKKETRIVYNMLLDDLINY